MFQFIKIITEEDNFRGFGNYGSGRISKMSHQIVDTEFESELYYVDNVECLYPRLIIHEYSKRQLNVIGNLKRYYQGKITPICNNYFSQRSYKEAVLLLSNDEYTITRHYPHLNFTSYMPCILRHLKRMEFIGLLK